MPTSLLKVPERPAERPPLGRPEGRRVSARCRATDAVPKSWPLNLVDRGPERAEPEAGHRSAV
ncbi:hypothetical protein ABZY05_06180 [Streptomyces canus]|uniref:hypothetical protein n=1 Tax=Streptomyces canus TaxID=58343 RepID=UPI0033B66F28